MEDVDMNNYSGNDQGVAERSGILVFNKERRGAGR